MVQLEVADFTVLDDSIDLTKVPALPVTDTVAYVKQATTIIVQHLSRFSLAADEKLRQISSSISRLETELTILESKLGSIPGLEAVKAGPATTSTTSSQEPVLAVTNSVSVNHTQPSNAAQENISPVSGASQSATNGSSGIPVSVPAALPSPSLGLPAAQTSAPEGSETPVLTVQKDPVFEKYFKMLRMLQTEHFYSPLGAGTRVLDVVVLDSLSMPQRRTDKNKQGVPAAGVKQKMASEGLNPNLLDTPNAPSPSPSISSAAQVDSSESENGSSSDESD